MTQPDPLVKEFLAESAENLDQLDRTFVALEREPGDRALLASVFRTIHTIKGTCGFFGFAKLEAVTHTGENLLSRLRDGELLLTPESTTALLALVDTVREVLGRIEETGAEGEGDYSALVARLTALASAPAASAPAELPAPPPALAPPPAPNRSLEELAAAYLEKEVAHVSPTQESVAHTRTDSLVTPNPRRPAREAGSEPSADTIRVGVGLLDRLMTLVGELVLARNQILQHTATQKNPAFLRTTQRLNLITTELQEGVMKTRMQPIGSVWNKFPRVVRDLAAQCGKQVRLEMDGQDTELDRTILEAIKDPLTHVIRNAIDHGIETPAARAEAGKPAEGRVRLQAFHEGGQVNIVLADDGRGIDPERVKAKAVERGLIDRDQAARMSAGELCNLVFLPGFSTAEKVSNLSGRGVGMDVVKTNIEKIGGTADLVTRTGEGTAVRIKIPLTLAIIPALVVTTGGDRYCIPQVNLLELVRLEGEARRGIERVHDAPVYRLRGRLLPLVDLNHRLGVPGDAAGSDVVNIVVLQADGRPFGLVVDRINDTEEIVVKPLAKQLKGIPLFAGATIMGDGKVALILDVLGLAQQAAVLAGKGPRPRAGGADAAGDPAGGSAARHLLLAAVGSRRLAIPLELVARLEEIPASALEDADGQEVVQYRGRIMPVVHLGSTLGCPTRVSADDLLQVVVYTHGGSSVGLVVDRILDVAEATVELSTSCRRPGVLGSGVVQGRVTDLIDLPEIVRATVPTFCPAGEVVA